MNIKASLEKIYQTGLSDKQIGIYIGASQSMVNRLRHGIHKSTGYERGQKIQQLYNKLCLSKTTVQEFPNDSRI